MKRLTTILMIGTTLLLLCGSALVADRVIRHNESQKLKEEKQINVVKTDIESQMMKTNQKDLEIPVYYERDLFFDPDLGVPLGKDNGFREQLNSRTNDTGGIMQALPEQAIRERDENSRYMMFDSDTGYRLYYLFSNENNYETPVGYPLVIKQVHNYSDFSRLKEGDSISLVEEIDDVATLTRVWVLDYRQMNRLAAENELKAGYPITSIHYLDDGLLKIEYTMKEEGKLIIANMEYHEDYKMVDCLGRIIDYRLLNEDIPT